MEYLQTGQKQLVELFESMSPGARVTSGLLLAVVVLSVYWLFQTQASPPDELLLSGTEFSRSDLDAMEAAFAQEGLTQYERLGSKVRIPRGQRDVYVAALAKHKALPTDFHDIFSRSLNEVSPWQDAKTRESRLKFAKQRELSLVVSALAGIEQATVQFDEHVTAGFPRTVHKTAVVAVRPVGSQSLSDEQAETIVEFMVHAVAGLRPENVTVTDLKSNRSIVGNAVSNLGAGKDPYPARKLMYERDWTEKIRRLLAHIPGAAVSVNVELDPVVQQREHSSKIDPKPVTLESRGEKRIESSQSAAPGGRPGVVTNTANQSASVGAAGTNRSQQTEEVVESQRNAVSQDQVVSDRVGLVPNRVTVAVTIPTAYYLQMHRQRQPAAAGQDPKPLLPAELEALEKEVETRISNTVTPLLPKRAAGVDPYPQVVVTRLPDLPTEPVVVVSGADHALGWLAAHWSTLGMFAVGLFALFTLRGLVATAPAPTSPEGAADEGPPALRVVRDEGTDDETDEAASRRRRFSSTGPDLREELADLVREDPEAAAKILRNWIGDVG